MARRTKNSSDLNQMPLFVPESDWEPPDLDSLPSWEGAKRVCVDVETNDPHLDKLGCGAWRDGHAVGVAFSIEDEGSYYLPFGHLLGGNLDPVKVAQYLRDQAKVFKGEIAGAHLQYDINYLWTIGVSFKPKFYRDTEVAESLCDELQYRYGLDAVAERREIPGKDRSLLEESAQAFGFEAKKDLWRLHSRFVGPYAERDVELPLELLRIQERQIDRENLWEVYDLESRLLPVLAKMHQRGVRIDLDKLDQVEKHCREQQEKAVDEINARTGCSVGYDELNKSAALAKPLVEIGVDVPLTPKNRQPSVTQELLGNIDHPVARAMLRAKKHEKVIGTFVNSIRSHVVGEYLHCEFHQLRREKDDGTLGGPRFGRISSSDPNIQQQPSPDRDPELGTMWRDIYIPEDGTRWACHDYSQQEPRWIVHYSIGRGFDKAAEIGAQYASDSGMDFHQMMADMTGLPRPHAKIIFLAICYGKGGASLCRDLGLPTTWIEVKDRKRSGPNYRPHAKENMVWLEVAGDEGQAILDQFYERAPFIRKLSKYSEGKANSRGYIKTFSGRRCRFPRDFAGSYEWTHKAINRLIQGSSADQTKAAMVALDDEGFPLRLQIHDEIDMNFTDIKRMQEAREIMENIYELRVPMKVDLEVGPSWGRAKEAV